MTYKKINFKDRIDTKPSSYIVNGEVTTIEKDNTGLKQEGSNLNAENLNHLEEGIFQNSKSIEEIKKESEKAQEITYIQLKKIIEDKKLKTGGKYLLTDYATKYQQPTSKIIKTAEVEPLLLTASGNDTLEVVAYSPKYPQDVIYYDFNNNTCEDDIKTARNGFITNRIDTVNKNQAPADFRSILWVRYAPDEKQYYLKGDGEKEFKLVNYEVWTSGEAKTGVLYKNGNKILKAKNTNVPKSEEDTNVFDIVFEDITSESCALFINDKTKIYKDIRIKIGKQWERKTFGENCQNNILGMGQYCRLFNNVFDNSCNNNTFGNDCNSNTFGNNCTHNSFGNGCSYNVFVKKCYFNKFNNNCNSNTFGNNCGSNTFGDSCTYNSFGNNCNDNTFGNTCGSNTFGNNCYYNSFGNNCNDNTFGNTCNSNAFGNSCYYNSFGNSCNNNTFGNGCNSNTFGNNCGSNTFGDSCGSNTFGNSCYSNSFGNNCNDNTFGNNCCYNSFGNGCSYNAFGNNCYYNSFDNGCEKNKFDDSYCNNSFGNNCDSNTFGNNCYYNSFGNNCNNNTFGIDCNSNSFDNTCNNNTFGNGCNSNAFGNSCGSNTFGDTCCYNSFGNNCISNKINSKFQYAFVKTLQNKNITNLNDVYNKKITLTFGQDATSTYYYCYKQGNSNNIAYRMIP